jgi:hypothetical protein
MKEYGARSSASIRTTSSSAASRPRREANRPKRYQITRLTPPSITIVCPVM